MKTLYKALPVTVECSSSLPLSPSELYPPLQKPHWPKGAIGEAVLRHMLDNPHRRNTGTRQGPLLRPAVLELQRQHSQAGAWERARSRQTISQKMSD